VSDFNAVFTDRLLEAAVAVLRRHGVSPRRIEVFRVPGSFDIPVVVKRALSCRSARGRRRYGAFITLGVVLKGRTRHWKQVSDAAAAGTLRAALDTGVPVVHGVVTAATVRQAADRAGGRYGNRGADAALAALRMAGLMKEIG
jgi:6,7-dimethyl-8-ribityllumazine synthase